MSLSIWRSWKQNLSQLIWWSMRFIDKKLVVGMNLGATHELYINDWINISMLERKRCRLVKERSRPKHLCQWRIYTEGGIILYIARSLQFGPQSVIGNTCNKDASAGHLFATLNCVDIC